MIRERLRQLFANYDPALQSVIAEVITLEQELISFERPRGITEQIDDIIERAAKKAHDQANSSQSQKG